MQPEVEDSCKGLSSGQHQPAGAMAIGMACSDYIVDVLSELRLCRCGYPKQAHVDKVVRNRRRTLTSNLLGSWIASAVGEPAVDGPNAQPQAPKQQACEDYMVDTCSNLSLCRCGFAKADHPSASPSNSVRQLHGTVLNLAQNFSAQCKPRTTSFLQAKFVESYSKRKPQTGLEQVAADGSDNWEEQKASLGEFSRHDPESVSECDTTSATTAAGSSDCNNVEEQEAIIDALDPDFEDQSDENRLSASDADEEKLWNDAAVAAARATFHRVRPTWTKAAEEAEKRAMEEQLAAGLRAAAVRAKDIAAAAKARERDEAKAAKLRAKEQEELEERCKQAHDETARKQLAREHKQIEQRDLNRMRRAQEREAEALRQAEVRELAERERAAKVAAIRTVAVTCTDGTLMVAPEELQILERYVQNFTSKTVEELADLLPKLHMGAWLQGSKHLFICDGAKGSKADAAKQAKNDVNEQKETAANAVSEQEESTNKSEAEEEPEEENAKEDAQLEDANANAKRSAH